MLKIWVITGMIHLRGERKVTHFLDESQKLFTGVPRGGYFIAVLLDFDDNEINLSSTENKFSLIIFKLN